MKQARDLSHLSWYNTPMLGFGLCCLPDVIFKEYTGMDGPRSVSSKQKE